MSFYKPHERRYTLHEVRLHGKQEKALWKLFWSTLYLSAFTFRGGYVIVTLMKRKFVDQFHWIEENEMLDLVAIAQSAPGAVGYKLAGIPGAIAATIGSVLPSCILMTLIARLYLKYRSLNALRSVLGTLRPAVVAMIASAGVSILMTAFWGEGAAVTLAETNWVLFGIFAVCFLLLRKTKLNPIAVMVLAGVLNLAAALISGGA